MLGHEDVQTWGLGHTGSGREVGREGGVNQPCRVRAGPRRRGENQRHFCTLEPKALEDKAAPA